MRTRIRGATQTQDHGFTLIELLVVIVIIAILATLAIPAFLNQRQKGWDATIKSDLRNAATAEETFLTSTGTYTTTVDSGTTNAVPPTGLSDVGLHLSGGGAYAGGTPVITVTVDAANSYCLAATSASGNAYSYDSSQGGFVTGGC